MERRANNSGVKYITQGLSGCKKCGVPLQLSHAIGIKTPGLSALLKVSIFTIVYNARSQCNLIKIRSLIFFSVSIVATRGATIEKEGADQLPDFNQIGSQWSNNLKIKVLSQKTTFNKFQVDGINWHNVELPHEKYNEIFFKNIIPM